MIPAGQRPPRLHAVGDIEAQVLTLRAAAFDRFRRRYAHNRGSQQTMVEALDTFARESSGGQFRAWTYPWELLADDQDVFRLWCEAVGDRSRNTAQKWATAIRVMLGCCRRVGLIDDEQFTFATEFETKGVGRVLPRAGRYLSEADIGLLLEACERAGRSNRGTRIRDRALIAALASSGIRSVEITGLEIDCLVLTEQRMDLRVTKGSREREAWLHPTAVETIAEWLEIRGRAPGPLFVPLSRTGRPLLDRGALSYLQVWKILRSRAEQAGLGVVTPHDLRRFLITTLLDKGYDLILVCRIAGHVRPETTAGYDRRPAAAQRAAIESLTLRPFERHTRSRPGD